MIVPHEFSLKSIKTSTFGYSIVFQGIIARPDPVTLVSAFISDSSKHLGNLNNELRILLRSESELSRIWFVMNLIVANAIEYLENGLRIIRIGSGSLDYSSVARNMARVVAVFEAAKAIIMANKSRISTR